MLSENDGNNEKRVLMVLGTRPEAIKLAPLARTLGAGSGVTLEICNTSQHRDLVMPVLDFFRVKVDFDLDVGTGSQTPAEVTARVTQGVSKLLSRKKYDRVVVQGDTSSALGGGLAAFYQGVRLAHVEAGLRSGDLHLPFPEEGHRRMLDALAEELFVPTQEAFLNLQQEGIPPQRIHLTGNTGIDALLWAQQELTRNPRPLDIPVAENQKLVLLTTHRRESFGAPLERTLQAVAELARRHPDVCILFPVHPNPRVREVVHAVLGSVQGVHLREPMVYPDFVQALMRADLILTDSGGLQEEAGALGKPILILRDDTERPEGVRCGFAELVGTDSQRILERAEAILERPSNGAASFVPLYGNGQACARILEVFLDQGRKLKIAA